MTAIFADDPAEYFGYDNWNAHQHPREEIEALQLEALKTRFANLKDKLPPLTALAGVQGITEIETLDDIVPLLFPHNIYKSYPENLVLEADYQALSKWLERLTVHDCDALDGLGFETMDDWMDAMDDQTEIDICHSSGTSGKLSFYPRGKQELKLQYSINRMKYTDRNWGRQFRYGDRFYSIIWPAHAFGRTSILRAAQILRDLATENEEDFHPYLPTALSSDYHYYVMRCHNLLAQGETEAPPPSEYVRMRLEEADALKRDIPQLQQRLLDTVAALKYKRPVMILGTPITIHQFASAGLERGMENMMMEDSFINTAGGFKHNPVHETLYDDVKRFTGKGALFQDSYSMTELIAGFEQCDYARYHIPPWIVAFLLDVKTGELLPRKGKQKGRAAFFDLPVQTYWGGTVTADNIEIDWGSCPCSRNTPSISPGFDRITETADELYIGSASKAGIDAAVEALNAGFTPQGERLQ